MHNTGVRVQEIVDIKLNDLRLDAASQIKLTGKGKKQRVCPLWEETIEAVNAYISVRKPKQEAEHHLFLNDKGESITRFGIRYIIKKYTDKAIKEHTKHTLILNPGCKRCAIKMPNLPWPCSSPMSKKWRAWWGRG